MLTAPRRPHLRLAQHHMEGSTPSPRFSQWERSPGRTSCSPSIMGCFLGATPALLHGDCRGLWGSNSYSGQLLSVGNTGTQWWQSRNEGLETTSIRTLAEPTCRVRVEAQTSSVWTLQKQDGSTV